MIQFQDVSFKYPYEEYSLFDKLSFTLPEGLSTVLCDVQSGKTTLCKLILGQLSPDSGKVLVDGVDVSGKSAPLPSALYLPDKPAFFEGKSVLYNLQYPLRARKQLQKQDARVTKAAQTFGLENLLKVRVKKLTSSQRKLLALARGFTVPREVVLFDGFFDDTIEGLQTDAQDVALLLRCKTAVAFTAKATLACGNTVVLDGKQCVFQGESSQAQQVIASLEWLADKI